MTDALCVLEEGWAPTDVGNNDSDYRLDLQSDTSGENRNLAMRVKVTTAFTAASTDLAVTFQVITCDTATGTYVVNTATKAYAKTELTAGVLIVLPIGPNLSRYVKGRIVIAGEAATAGAVTADIIQGAGVGSV